MAIEPIQRLYGEKDTAKMLDISPNTLRQWRHMGVGPEFVKIGAAVKYAAEALDAYIEANTVRPRKTVAA